MFQNFDLGPSFRKVQKPSRLHGPDKRVSESALMVGVICPFSGADKQRISFSLGVRLDQEASPCTDMISHLARNDLTSCEWPPLGRGRVLAFSLTCLGHQDKPCPHVANWRLHHIALHNC